MVRYFRGILEKIEKAIEGLAPQELACFRAWFDNYDSARFDEKIERDAQNDKWGKLAKQAFAAHRSGSSRELL